MKFYITTKYSQQEEMVSGQGIDNMILTVQDMLGRGAPTEWDYSGFNKHHYNYFSDFFGISPGTPLAKSRIIQTMQALRTYAQTQLPNYQQLRTEVAQDLNLVGGQAQDPQNTNIIKYIAPAAFDKLTFFIPNFRSMTKSKRIIAEKMSELSNQGMSQFDKQRDRFTGTEVHPTYKGIGKSKQHMDAYEIHPLFIDVLVPFLQGKGYDTTEMEVKSSQSPLEGVRKQEITKKITALLNQDGSVTIDYNDNPGPKVREETKLMNFRGTRVEENGKFSFKWVNPKPTRESLEHICDLTEPRGYDCSELRSIIKQLPEDVEGEDRRIQIEVRDVSDDTGNRWHMGIKFLRKGTYEGETLKDILKYSFINYSKTLDEPEGSRSLNKDTWETYIAGNMQEYMNFISSLNNRGYDSSIVSQIVASLIQKGIIKPMEGIGFLDGYGTREKFYEGIDSYNLPFELYPEQKEGIAKLYSHRSFLKGDETGAGKCCVGDTNVFINDRISSLEKIWEDFSDNINIDNDEEWADTKKDLYVQSMDQNGKIIKSKVSKLFRQKYKGKLRKIKTSHGREITTSFPHKFLTQEGIWENNVKIGDIISSPSKFECINDKNDISVELATLMAWQIAEGYESKNRARVTITQKDLNILNNIKNIFNSLELKRPNGDKAKCRIRQYGEKSSYLEISSKEYKELLESYGHKWGRLSRYKEIPWVILSSKDEVAKQFLKCYFDAESSSHRGTIEICSASHIIIKQLSFLLTRFGIYHSFKERFQSATNGKNIKRKYYYLNIIGEGTQKYLDEIGFGYSYKTANCENNKKRNYNKGGLYPLEHILNPFYKKYHMPYRSMVPHKKYIRGERWASKDIVNDIIENFKNIKNGTFLMNYKKLKKSKWTEKTLEIYSNIKEEDINNVINQLTDLINTDLSFEKIIKLEEIDFEGYIYDLSIKGYHNYIANGLLTHNTAQGILAADMRIKHSGGRTVIVTKNAVQDQFMEAIAEFLHLDINDRTQISDNASDRSQWTVLTYPKFGSPQTRKELTDELVMQTKNGEITCLLLDESHGVKNGNPSSKAGGRVAARGMTEEQTNLQIKNREHASNNTTFNIQDISANVPFVWGLSATVVANKAIDVYNQLKAINHPLGQMSWGKFAVEFGAMVPGRFGLEDGTIDDQIEAVNKLKEFMFDHKVYDALSKKQLNKEMPDQNITKEMIPIDQGRLWYNVNQRLSKYKKPELEISQMQAFRNEIAIEKVNTTTQNVLNVLNQDRKVMVFTDFRDSLQSLRENLQGHLDKRQRGEQVVSIYGGMSKKKRKEAIDSFKNDPNAKAIVINIIAGGTGLDFPNITTDVFVNDYDWSVANDEQALGRAYRINSKEDVNVTYTIAEGTPDEDYYARLAHKKRIADIIHKMSMEQDALMKEGHRRGMSKQLKAIEKKLNQAKKEFIMMEKTDKSFVKSLQKNIKNDIKKASTNNWYKKIKIS